MRTQKIMKWSFLAVMLLGNISISCTKYDTPDFVEETGGVSGNLSVKKNVLWINLEGAGGGDLVKNAFPGEITPEPLCMEWLGIGAYRRYLYSYC